MITLSINGNKISVDEGTTIHKAARSAGIRIPSLCYSENRAPEGACRVCMVELEGAKTLVASCAMPVT